MPLPVQPKQPRQHGAQAQYIPNVPTAGELGLAAHVDQPFVSSHLLNAQMERRLATDANNQAAAAAAEEQARQFDESLKATLRGQTMGALDSDYGGWAAGQLGADPNMIAVNEKLRQDAAAAESYGKYSTGATNLAGVGAEMPTAVAGTPLEGVKFGELPAVSMNNADNAASLRNAEIAAAASRYGSQLGLQGAQARANADAMPRITTTIPGGATGISHQVQGTDAASVQAQADALAGQTGRPTRAQNVAPDEQQSAWGPGLKSQALAKGYTVDEGTQVQFIEHNGQRVPAIVAKKPDGTPIYVTGAPGG